MELTMLGTGNANVTEYFNTCFLLEEAGQYFLVDTGGGNGILKALKNAGVSVMDIHDIFITHEHLDHLLGLFWIIRTAGHEMSQGNYPGELRIYCHSGLVSTIRTIVELTIWKKTARYLAERILLIPVESGETREIAGCRVTFFDTGSTKARQFGFTLENRNHIRLSCCGDEPARECEFPYIKDSHWLLHEAFCLYRDADKYHPDEIHHSTVREACTLAERFRIPNLVLYHTEEDTLADRKTLYTEEGKQFYHGNLYVPWDGEKIRIV